MSRTSRRDLSRYRKAWLREHARAERRLQRALREVFNSEAANIRERVADGIVNVPALFDPAAFADKLRATAEPQLIRAAATGATLESTTLASVTKAHRTRRTKAAGDGGELVAEILDSFELSPEVSAGIKKAIRESIGASYWQDTAEAMRDELAEALQTGLEDGAHFGDLADTIGNLLGGDAARVLRIATTETTGALNGGHWAARSELIDDGLVSGSEWLTSGDSLVRDDHEAANGQVAGADGMFEIGGEKCRYPGDPNLSAAQRINCRCLTIASGVWIDSENNSE